MNVYLESTDRIVTIDVQGGGQLQARVWEGQTDSGIPVVALVPRIAVPEGYPQDQFRAELKEHSAPSEVALRAYPLRLVI